MEESNVIIHILAGGPAEAIPDLQAYKQRDVIWAAADRGVFRLLKQGIVPEAAFGDYDSVTEEELNWMKEQTSELHIVPKEKDQTDLELALNWAIKERPKLIRIFGATGGRLDHALANIQMLIKGLNSNIDIHLIDYKNKISLKNPGIYEVQQEQDFPYLSFLPVTDIVTGINLNGFKYPLINKTLHWGSTLCVSNELNEEKGTFSFETGILMVVRSTD
ncbi:thiamine diphosphokinase [Bacillus sp. 165]|uniref:thiamine diphosphokinase n=1 Tax=Bacillus sp. 165 TaxID=1529117 RepID=UPI001ADD1504|nr:thiamine diphosphokinase [Bacillus sp. 165]MBO9130203.1 thiamine diphosphokinase [Bacillus sp. 165]